MSVTSRVIVGPRSAPIRILAAVCRAVKSSRLHAGYRFAASLLSKIVRASTHPFKICPKLGFVHSREPGRTLLNRREVY
jgi:hypothetical protein